MEKDNTNIAIEEEDITNKKKFSRFGLPVVSLGAEFLVMGHLMRRNILTYKAPPNNEGYDLISLHPNPNNNSKLIRIQVKSRYSTDGGRGVPIKEKSFKSFDYLIIVLLNIGFYLGKHKKGQHAIIGKQEPEFYTIPVNILKKYHSIAKNNDWEKIMLKNIPDSELEKYKNEKGFELIAKRLKVDYPTKL